jgi:predicted esterase
MSVDGRKAHSKLSPLAVARGLAGGAPPGGGGAGALLPPALLVHGTADQTVPHAGSELMRGALEALGVRRAGGRAGGRGAIAQRTPRG